MKWERIFCFVCKIFFCKQVSFICLSLVYCTIMCIILHSEFRKYLGDIKWNGQKLLTRVTNLKCFWMLSSAFNQNPLRSKQIYCLIIHIIYERERERERIISLFIGTLCLELELSIRMALKVKWMTVECRMHLGCNQDRIPAGPSDAQCFDYENHNLIFIKSLLILYSLAWLKEENTRRGSGGGEGEVGRGHASWGFIEAQINCRNMQCANSLTREGQKEKGSEGEGNKEREREVARERKPSEPRNKRADIVFRNHFFAGIADGLVSLCQLPFLPPSMLSSSLLSSLLLLNFSPIAHTKWNYPWELLSCQSSGPAEMPSMPDGTVFVFAFILKNASNYLLNTQKKHTYSISLLPLPQLASSRPTLGA